MSRFQPPHLDIVRQRYIICLTFIFKPSTYTELGTIWQKESGQTTSHMEKDNGDKTPAGEKEDLVPD